MAVQLLLLSCLRARRFVFGHRILSFPFLLRQGASMVGLLEARESPETMQMPSMVLVRHSSFHGLEQRPRKQWSRLRMLQACSSRKRSISLSAREEGLSCGVFSVLGGKLLPSPAEGTRWRSRCWKVKISPREPISCLCWACNRW